MEEDKNIPTESTENILPGTETPTEKPVDADQSSQGLPLQQLTEKITKSGESVLRWVKDIVNSTNIVKNLSNKNRGFNFNLTNDRRNAKWPEVPRATWTIPKSIKYDK